jgi:hypothetical protein
VNYAVRMNLRTRSALVNELENKQAELRAQLGRTGDLRPGSLVERYRRCGKAGCHCAADDAPGHGPSWSLTHAEGGKTVTRVIPAAHVGETRQQLEEYKRFRIAVREFIETSEKLCDARLRDPDVSSLQEVSKRPPPKGGGFRYGLKPD